MSHPVDSVDDVLELLPGERCQRALVAHSLEQRLQVCVGTCLVYSFTNLCVISYGSGVSLGFADLVAC